MAKKAETLKIVGRIIDRTKKGVAGLRVEAWDKDLICDDLVGSAITDAQGSFEIDFEESYFRELFADREPDLFFKIFHEDNLVHSTEDRVLWNVQDGTTEIVVEGDFDHGPPQDDEQRQVKGKVLFADGSAAAGFEVKAFNRDLRNEQQLGESRSDKQGLYQINYTASHPDPSAAGVGLVVKAIAESETVLAASQVIFDPGPITHVDVNIPAEVLAPSLFEKIGRAIAPLLKDVPVKDLNEDAVHQDVSFLSGQTGFNKTAVARYVLAHKLKQDRLPPEFWFALLNGSLFQFAENQDLDSELQTVTKGVSSLDATAVRKSLLSALNQNEIPKLTGDQIEELVEIFIQFVAHRAIADTAQPTFLKSAVEDAGIQNPKQQETFARLFHEQKAFTPELLAALENDRSFKKQEVADLHTSFRLAELTGADYSVVKTIKKEFGISRPEDIRTLAKKSEHEWIELVRTKHAAGEIKLPVEVGEVPAVKMPEAEAYGKTLERQFREAFPTTAFAGGLARALENGGAHGLKHGEALRNFLDQHQDFELLHTPIDEFLQNNTHSDSKKLSRDEDFVEELKAAQRVFKVAQTFAAVDALLADDLHSAQRIYRLGESQFAQRYGNRDADGAHEVLPGAKSVEAGAARVASARATGLTAEDATAVWNRAADTHAAALTIVADLKALDPNSLPQALQSAGSQALSNFPNWENLFKSGDLCDCEACRSVLSPAAYFADLLMFLKDRRAANLSSSVKDILFNRRPDLGYLELNCENALTTLPYIDVVNEVLEAAIAGDENDVELLGLTSIPDTSAATKAAVANALQGAALSYGADFSLSQVDPTDPDRWVVHGETRTYLLKKKTTANFFAEVLRNTKAKSDELRAYPQYVNPKAYDKLRGVKYPLALPFDLFAEEVRATMQKANLRRWDLMTTFRGNSIPNNPNQGEIAAEYFGISVDTAALRFNGVMTAAQRAILLTDPSLTAVTGMVPYQQAVQELFQGPTYAAVKGLPAGFLFPAVITGGTNHISISYEPFSFDEKQLILTADTTTAGQRTLWGETNNPNWLDVTGNLPHSLCIVKNFLQKTGLEYNELLTLLDLKFINPTGNIAVHHLDSSCDTAKKVIGILDETKLDRIHRFLRLWRKLNGWKMWELDLVIRHPNIGNGALDEPFLIKLFYFARLKDRLGSKASVEQVCSLFANLNTESHFTKLYEQRDDSLYQQLFLNRRLINPLDAAFEIDPTMGDLAAGQTIAAHRPVIAAALGRTEPDLIVLENLTKASDGLPYINGDLTLHNLSFLWRHAWLSKSLKLKADDWRLILKLGQQDILSFTDPKSAWEFVALVDQLKASGFKPDELNWLLAADRSAKSAVKDTDAARFLTTLRNELQKIHNENDPAQFGFLTAAPPTDEGQLSALLTTLLQKLGSDDAHAKLFLAILRGRVELEADVQQFPANPLVVFTSFPASITGMPNNIPIDYDLSKQKFRFTGLMTTLQRKTLLTDPSLAAVTADSAYQTAIDELYKQSLAALSEYAVTELEVVLPGVTLPPTQPSIPIRYDAPNQKLSFIGVMTLTERTALIAAGNPAGAIKELFKQARLQVKFFEPAFSSPLAELPPTINFPTQLSADLAAKISYDSEQRLLRFSGIMTAGEQLALDALVLNLLPAEVAYHSAVSSLFSQPQTIVPPDERVWLTDVDLDPTQPANDTLAKRLAHAATKALNYLSRTLAVNAVIRQSSAQLKLTEAMTRLLLTQYAIVPGSPLNDTLLEHLKEDFAVTTAVVDYSDLSLTPTFDSWFWATLVAALWKKWKITLREWQQLTVLIVGSQLLDVLTLPLNSSLPIASIDRLLRTSSVMRLRDSLPQTEITFLEVLQNLSLSTYTTTNFAADIERLNENWIAADVLVGALDLNYPSDYLLAESWERLQRAYEFLAVLNTGPSVAKVFAAPAMNDTHVASLKGLLRTKYGTETWLPLSTEIQDVLRERKRDALAAFLLTQPPADAPTKKWENTNDLYAYYLLDIEMSSCQLTSRLVQASGSIQLFVQRCFMGLEPKVEVKADGATGDSAWRWWSWMRKYRVWEANRKVFLWPENWIEPELKPDRSQFFKDLENELLQNEINQPNVETAFENYLEKLDGVAQLEVAGFFQEDDGDTAIVHVFGRTKGAEPHIYYYRRYDYRQWTPWEKVDLDIHSDYLIPAVIEHRLFLFWPVFADVPNEEGNNTVSTPSANQTDVELQKTKKNLRMQLAVSVHRQGKWTPKRISNDSVLSNPYEGEIEKRHYQFFLIDRSEIDNRLAIRYEGYSLGTDGVTKADLFGAFEIAGCKGIPELATLPGYFRPATRPLSAATGSDTEFQKWLELGTSYARLDAPHNDFTLETYDDSRGSVMTRVLLQTPWLFSMTAAWHMSYFDKLLLDGLVGQGLDNSDRFSTPLGNWLPFFYNDKKRTFFVLPSAKSRPTPAETGEDRDYYPQVKKMVRKVEDFYEGELQRWLAGFKPATLTKAQRAQLEQFLQQQLREERNPPYTDTQLKGFLKKHFMRFFHGDLGTQSMQLFQLRQLHFKNFYHPFVCAFAKTVYNPLAGIPALMSRETQLQNSGFSFRQSYAPTTWVVNPPTEKYYPTEVVDFTPDGAYSSYNWELFFHAPLLIANALSKNQRFEEARDWYHFVFNPMGVESSMPGASTMSKFWITKPFFQTTDSQYLQQRINNILGMLAGNANPDLENQVLDSRNHPFAPHRIANYRTVAYQKTTMMKYLDNLISWGDYLFRQDSMESINEATQLYVLAAELLGPRPKNIPPQARPPLETFNELENQFDDFSNALVQVENLVPPLPGNGSAGNAPPLPMLYFCIPQNEKMLGYWTTVAHRLYKIRHCMNIEGVVRQLALFEPPIDPGALVKAAAAGLDISSALADLNAPMPFYRFNVVLQKANEMVGDVKALGGALLAALEKKDAEALGLLRQSQELRLLGAVKAVREQQIEEAIENVEGIRRSRKITEERRNFYRDVKKVSDWEAASMVTHGLGIVSEIVSTVLSAAAGTAELVPDFTLGASGFGGSPHVVTTYGGNKVAGSASKWAGFFGGLGGILHSGANLMATQASNERRWDDWKLQERVAEKELLQLDKQIAAAELRVALAEKELTNHLIQIENAKATDDFMRSKYTHEELYQWQVGQISGVYFQSYKLAHDLSKRAERCFRFELGIEDSSYISFGYWDSLKKGLLSGENLQYDLRRLENAYLNENRREFELTKHISLALLNPMSLVKLRETGRCFFEFPEEIFDLDYPGHYFRRIKSVSVTLPCVTGPYTTISCTLRLLKSNIRINTDLPTQYARNAEDGLPADDDRFIENNIAVKAIAASGAQNDSGLFELNFRDDRYLPFEGAGAISAWSLELLTDPPANNPKTAPPDFGSPLRQFDYRTISDAIVHIRYTAREDAGPFKDSAVKNLREYFRQTGATPSLRLLDLRQEFPSQWHRFLTPANPGGPNIFEFEVSPSLFPIKDADKTLSINSIWLLARCVDSGTYDVLLTLPQTTAAFSLPQVNQFGRLHLSQKDVSASGIELVPTDPPALWQLQMTRPGSGNLQTDEVGDLILVLGYAWE